MKNKTLRTFVIEGKEMQFNLTFFNNIFKTKAKQEKKGIGELEEELATEIFVEKATVHAWRNRVNGPSDLEKVQQIAEFFKIEKEDLLIEVEEMFTCENREAIEKNGMTIAFGDREKDAFKRVYKEMLSFMELRLKYDGQMLDELRGYFMRDIELECWPEDQKDTEEYFNLEMDLEYGTLEGYLENVLEDWGEVNFCNELEKVGRVLEEEMVDMPNELYVLFETFICLLENTNSDKDFLLGYDFSSKDAEDNYLSECIENRYFKNEKIISGIKENVRALLFELKS